MSIHMITGKPGGGKSLYATSLLIKELLEGERLIVTNLDIDFEGLNRYMDKKGREDIILEERITILIPEETREFYLYRGDRCLVPVRAELPPKELKKGRVGPVEWIEVEHVAGGVFYLIDEAWMFFAARDYQNTSAGVEVYARQHRKLGDTVLLTTHSAKDVDRIIRDTCQDFTRVTNFNKQKILSVFTALPVFRRVTYADASPGLGAVPLEDMPFTLDAKGIASCYRTASGVGVKGKKADTLEKIKGIPIWVVPIVGCLVLWGVWKGGSMAVASVVHKSMPALHAESEPPVVSSSLPATSAPAVVQAPLPAPNLSPVVAEEKSQAQNSVVQRPEKKPRKLYVTGWTELPSGQWMVCFSDGRVIKTPDKRLQVIGDNAVLFEGQVVTFDPSFYLPRRQQIEDL